MKIITYNIHRGVDVNNKISLKSIEKYLSKSNADIICLQEVLYPQFIKMKAALKMNGIFACNVKTDIFSYGICTFSKLDIENYNHTLITSKKEQRGILAIEVQDKESKINIINAHLGLDRQERAQQLDEIINYSSRLIGEIVICGDFNEKNISLNNFNDVAVCLNKYQMPTFIPTKSRIDYLFTTKNLYPNKYNIELVTFSDHYPVTSDIDKCNNKVTCSSDLLLKYS